MENNNNISNTEKEEETKNFLGKPDSNNIILDNKSEFTFKQNQLKTSVNNTNNKFINEDEEISRNKKRDPLIHDYPLEITNSVEDLI